MPLDHLPKLPTKHVSASTWVWGTGETLLVPALMIGAYLASGALARRRTAVTTPAAVTTPDQLVEA